MTNEDINGLIEKTIASMVRTTLEVAENILFDGKQTTSDVYWYIHSNGVSPRRKRGRKACETAFDIAVEFAGEQLMNCVAMILNGRTK